MGMLRKIERQHEWFRSRVCDFDTAVCECRLRDESNLRINLSKNHVLMIPNFQLTDATASTIRVEQSGTLRTEIQLPSGLQAQS